MRSQLFLFTAVVLSFCGTPYSATAETVTTKTYIHPQTLENVNQINFSEFDVNGDRAYSMGEVGERLFQSFDQDGNHNIDNIEWDKKSVMTIIPMEKETFRFYDADDDDIAEEETYTYENFYIASGLIKFDSNQDGLSAKEFIDEGFEALDDDENKMIDLEEWKKAYIQSRPKHNDPISYNN